ncbi:hypothetical protein C0J52_25200 [Blattella germanica]|nr:hypothetical protein C0J52_25200 [Blattella germanica]
MLANGATRTFILLSTAAARVENTKLLTLSFPTLLLHKLNYTYHFPPYCSIN